MQTRHIGRVGLPSGLLSGTAFLSWEKIKFYDDFSLEAPVEFGKKIEWILTLWRIRKMCLGVVFTLKWKSMNLIPSTISRNPSVRKIKLKIISFIAGLWIRICFFYILNSATVLTHIYKFDGGYEHPFRNDKQ